MKDHQPDRPPQATKLNNSIVPIVTRPPSPPLAAGKRPGTPISQPKAIQPIPRQKDEPMTSHKPSVTPTFRSDFRNDGARGDSPRRDVSSQNSRAEGDNSRRLVVGKDISLNGEINTCDCLVVEGTVEARVKEGRRIEISPSGFFKGTVEIHEADIAGTFEGDITTRGRLTIRSTGVVTGKVQYAELEIEAGGCINGTLTSLKTAPDEVKTHARPSAIKTTPAAAERLQADLASETA